MEQMLVVDQHSAEIHAQLFEQEDLARELDSLDIKIREMERIVVRDMGLMTRVVNHLFHRKRHTLLGSVAYNV